MIDLGSKEHGENVLVLTADLKYVGVIKSTSKIVPFNSLFTGFEYLLLSNVDGEIMRASSLPLLKT